MKAIAVFTFCSLLCVGSVYAQSVTINPGALDLPQVTSLPSCSASTKGRMVYNSTDNKMYYCNGSAWINTEVAGPQNAPAFSVTDLGELNIQVSGTTFVPFVTETYDLGNNFNTTNAGTDPNTFIVPLNGIYHFDAYVSWSFSGATIQSTNYAVIQLVVNGSVVASATYAPSAVLYFNTQISRDLKLETGDKVRLAVLDDVAGNQFIKKGAGLCVFNGHLVTKY